MRHTLAALAGFCVLATTSGALAQEVTAEVRTWDGQTYVITDPTFEVFYTNVMSDTAAGAVGAAYAPAVAAAGRAVRPAALPPGVAVTGVETPGGFGTAAAPAVVGQGFRCPRPVPTGTWIDPCPETVQGRRQQDALTLSRAGVERRVPVASLAALIFLRQQIVGSPLPPWVAGTHYLYGASAVLTDGSQIQADYVNLGTSILRGATQHGLVDIPWSEVESIKFQR